MKVENTGIMELNEMEMATIAGGSPFEECFADSALYRAGVTFDNVCFGKDRFYVGSTRISKELARTLRSKSTELWNSKYSASADFVGYLREWKQTLQNEYHLQWNGQVGDYNPCVW